MKNLYGAAYLAYICVVINVVACIILKYYSIIELALIIGCSIGFGLGIQLAKSRICSMLLLLYALPDFIIAIS